MQGYGIKRAAAADAVFALTTAAMIVVAHAVAYLTHEFSHSFTAWALGYMSNPFALDYGGQTPGNLILLSDVSDNVRYQPILQNGHGLAATAIALAGVFLGNGLLYICLYAAMKRARTQSLLARPFGFWLLTMCTGNVWSYVPIRAITTHADIARTAMVIGMASTWFFFLYGGAGLSGSYGPVSQVFSLISALLLMPFAIVWLWHRCCSTPHR